MVTVSLLGLGLAAGLLVAFIALSARWTPQVAFVSVSWIPLVALVLEVVFFQQLAGTLSYAFVALPALTCLASVILAVIGATLLVAAGQRREPLAGLLTATILASMPALLFAGYLLWALAAYAGAA